MKRIPIFITVIVAALTLAVPAAAQEGEVPPFKLYTEFPAMEASPDETVTIDLELESSIQETVDLGVINLPSGWTAVFRGGGGNVHKAYLEPGEILPVSMRIDIPADTETGSYGFSAVASTESTQAELPLEILVVEEAARNLSINVSRTSVSGSPSTTFRYDAELENESSQEFSINLSSDAPAGFNTSFVVGGEEITGLTLGPNQSRQVTVEVQPAPSAASGTYPITISAQGAGSMDSTELQAEITGQPELRLTTPDGRLSEEAQTGKETPIKVLIRNTGSAPAREIEFSSNTPNGWVVTFDPEAIDEIASGQEREVTARIKPAEKAVAGDYQLTFSAEASSGEQASQDFRITVVTSTLWGIAGIGLIAIAVGVIALAVFRFGRR